MYQEINNNVFQEINNNLYQEIIYNNVYEEIPLIIEGHSIIINTDQDVYDNSNNFIIPEPCQRCNNVYCNSVCCDVEFPLPPSLTRIVTNAHIPDDDLENDSETGKEVILCMNCGKNPVIKENKYCFKDCCFVCNLTFYSMQSK